MAVANNGIYSDCRIRGPFSEAWQREVCRLISPRKGRVHASTTTHVSGFSARRRGSSSQVGKPSESRPRHAPGGFALGGNPVIVGAWGSGNSLSRPG